MIAFHYPPIGISSGVHRTLKFSQFLLDYGWKPIILTVNQRAYQSVSDDQMNEVPKEIVVKRTFAIDVAKGLSIRGRYPRFLAYPDRWSSWLFSGVFQGLRLVKLYKPEVIWSTFPISTSHLIALTISKLSGIPLVADFRDSMTEENYPPEPLRRAIFRWIEKKIVYHAKKVIFTTPGTLEMYQMRYPDVPRDRFVKIENGYDEEKFDRINIKNENAQKSPVMLLHSGLLYRDERNPIEFYRAIAELKHESKLSNKDLKIILRASGNEEYYQPIVKSMGIDDILSFEESLPYGEALKEMLMSNGLLLFQGSNCNHQIPAKLYEYIRAKKPIFAMTDPCGDTASVLKKVGIGEIALLDSKNDIKSKLLNFIQQIKAGTASIANDKTVKLYSRRNRSKELANLLDGITK